MAGFLSDVAGDAGFDLHRQHEISLGTAGFKLAGRKTRKSQVSPSVQKAAGYESRLQRHHLARFSEGLKFVWKNVGQLDLKL